MTTTRDQIAKFVRDTKPHVVLLIPSRTNQVSIETARSVMEVLLGLAQHGISAEPVYVNTSFYDHNREIALNLMLAKFMSESYGPLAARTPRKATHVVVMDPSFGVTFNSVLSMLWKMFSCDLPILAAAVPTDRLNMMNVFTQPSQVFTASFANEDDEDNVHLYLAKPSVDVAINGVGTPYSVQQQVGMHCTSFDVAPVYNRDRTSLAHHPQEVSIAYTTVMSTRFFVVQTAFLLKMHADLPALTLSAFTPVPPDWNSHAVDYFAGEFSDPRMNFSKTVRKVLEGNIPFDITVEFAIEATQYIKSVNYAMSSMDANTYRRFMEQHDKVMVDHVGPVSIV